VNVNASPEKCCFEHCDKPATHKLGGAVYFPMCDEHAAPHLPTPINTPPDWAWQQLPGGPEALDPGTHEVWQYMGPEHYQGRDVYCFRHRHHPEHQRRIYCRIAVAPRGWGSVQA
jgi:hypothetical protein